MIALLAAVGYIAVALWADWRSILDSAVRLGASGLLLALCLSLVNYGLRFVRWQLFLRALGHPQSPADSLIVYISGFALTTTPGKAGELLRSVLLLRRGIPFARSAAAFISERISDVVAIVLIALPAIAIDERMRSVLIFGALAICAAFVMLSNDALLSTLRARTKTRTTRPYRFVTHIIDMLEEARACHTPAILLAGLALAIAAWAAEGVAFWFVLERMGAEITPPHALFIYAAAMLAGALTFVPGGLGGTEAVMMALLLASGVAGPVGAAATLAIRLTTLWFAVMLGAAALTVEQKLTPSAQTANRLDQGGPV